MLSQTAQLFDPLNWLAPIIIRAKIIIQATWIQRLNWDAPLAPEEAAAWTELEEELPLLEGVRVPRWFRGDASAGTLEIHGFSDAFERAYAAVIYLRAMGDEEPLISLVLAKTKVAPVKRVTAPVGALCGGLTGQTGRTRQDRPGPNAIRCAPLVGFHGHAQLDPRTSCQMNNIRS
ncbi:gag-pol polyprotein precursor [Lasius niger]|uniref:Gag-pol polyprotein n=1 Tax=Lasius niger TaxID=67767 RepID=A0A0J7N3Q3_LASNI|nr:gag-pol polyprotein precursor [Lasius niger]